MTEQKTICTRVTELEEAIKLLATKTELEAERAIINTLVTTVGNSGSGLVKDVTDLKNAVGDEDTENTLVYIVKKSDTGLVAKVEELKEAVDGDGAQKVGLVNVVGNANAGLVKDVADHETRIETLENT
jgi:hypothetical protein